MLTPIDDGTYHIVCSRCSHEATYVVTDGPLALAYCLREYGWVTTLGPDGEVLHFCRECSGG